MPISWQLRCAGWRILCWPIAWRLDLSRRRRAGSGGRHRLVRWRAHLRIRHLRFTPLRHPSASALEPFQCSSTQERATAVWLFRAKEAVTVKTHCKHRRAASRSDWRNRKPFGPIQHKFVMESPFAGEACPCLVPAHRKCTVVASFRPKRSPHLVISTWMLPLIS